MIGRSIRVRVGLVLALSTMGAASGCGNGDFVPAPPPPSERAAVATGAGSPTSTAKTTGSEALAGGGTVRRIDYIMSSRSNPDELQYEAVGARVQAGFERARLHVHPDVDSGSESPVTKQDERKSQAEWIRESLADRTRALIIDPDDPEDKELAAAIGEARAAKVPVIVVGKPIAAAVEAKAAGAPMILVAPPPFTNSARKIVELAIRNVRTAKLDPGAGAIILTTTPGDRLMADRAAAIRKALEASGVKAIEELRVPKALDPAAAALRARIEKESKAVMVFFLDLTGASISNKVVADVGEARRFVQAGYSADDNRTRLVRAGEFAAACDYDIIRLIRKAVSVAAAAAQGKEMKDREELPLNVLESPAGSGTPHLQPIRSTEPAEVELPKKRG